MKHYKEWRTITIFISSTFLDMNAERDYIREKIRELEATYFRERHILLKTIDLRWGVTTQGIDEKDKESEILKVCFNEIKRSAPFFIALLGERYGWIPPHEQLQIILDSLDDDDKEVLVDRTNESVTHLEIDLGALKYNPLLKNSLFFFRDESVYNQLSDGDRGQFMESGANREKLMHLKGDIRSRCREEGLENNCIDYSPQWESGHFSNFESIGNAIEKMLKDCIDISSCDDQVLTDEWIADNLLDFEYFRYTANKNFGGFEDVVRDVIPSPGKCSLLVGADATGKSYLLAKCASEWQKQYPDGLLLYFHCSDSPSCNGLTYLYHQFIFQAARFIGVKYCVEDSYSISRLEELFSPYFKVNPKSLYLSRLQALHSSLVNYIRGKGFACAMIVDNLHKFAYGDIKEDVTDEITNDGDTTFRLLQKSLYRHLSYLGESLVSCNSDFVNHIFNSYEKQRIEIKVLRNVLPQEGTLIMSNYFKDYGKTLYSDIVEDFMNHHHNISPLNITATAHLLLNMDNENFRQLKAMSGNNEEEKIRTYVHLLLTQQNQGNYLRGIYEELINQAKRALGDEFVSQLLSFLAISHDGLSEWTLSNLMGDSWDDLKFARFNRMIPFLLHSSGSEKKWGFKHKPVKIWMQVYHQNQIYSLSEKFLNFCLDNFEERVEDKAFLAELFYAGYLRKETMVAYLILTYPEEYLSSVYHLIVSMMQLESYTDFLMWIAHTMFNLQGKDSEEYVYCVKEKLGNYLFKNGYYRECRILYRILAESSCYFFASREISSSLYLKAICYDVSACEGSPHKWVVMASKLGDDKAREYLGSVINGVYHDIVYPITDEMLDKALDSPDKCNHYIYSLYEREEYERCLAFAIKAAKKYDACKPNMILYGGYKYGSLVNLGDFVHECMLQCKDGREAFPIKLAYAYDCFEKGEVEKALDELSSPDILNLRPANYLLGLIYEQAGLWDEAMKYYKLADTKKPLILYDIYEQVFMDMRNESYEDVNVAPIYRIAIHYLQENKHSEMGLQYLVKAARNGHEEAVFKLAEYFDTSSYLFVKILEQAANYKIYGSVAAQKLLGKYFEDEKNTTTLPVTSVYWYERAALNNDIDSIKHLIKVYTPFNQSIADFWKAYAEQLG